MAKLRFSLVIHDHQPIGNFDGVIEQAFRDSYQPFLNVMDGYPDIPFSLHTSGSLLEWLVEHQPEYVDRLRERSHADRIEILGGGFYEPILTMIPSRDRRGQIRGYGEYLHELFGKRIRGIWIPERVWEQQLVKDIVDAGVEFTVLDDFHFRKTGLDPETLFGHFVTEDEGRLLKVFPGSESMRYLIPFHMPHEVIAYLREIHDRHPDAHIVFADDGEKFGTWPETKKHVYEDGWLRRFLDLLSQNLDWIDVTTLANAIDRGEPLGRIYLPDASYREMTEWALPTDRLITYERLWRDLDHQAQGTLIKEFLKGGFWRNFKTKYPESNDMYARMLRVSDRLERFCREYPESLGHAPLAQARQELYRGQCNCAYWHGAFGGLYLPHLRHAIHGRLIAAENHLLDFERGPSAVFVEVRSEDVNLDGRDEIALENDQLAFAFDPAIGGHLQAFVVRSKELDLSATLSRRPEAYHQKVRAPLDQHGGVGSIHDRVVFKQEGLAEKLIYDWYPRRSLVDHFFPIDSTLGQVRSLRVKDLGDFSNGRYRGTIAQSGQQALATLSRDGRVDGDEISLSKTILLSAGESKTTVRYRLEGWPMHQSHLFAVEFNIAALATGSDERYYRDQEGRRLGLLGQEIERNDIAFLGLSDDWLGVQVDFSSSKSGGVWSFPIETVSQSEGGFEAVHQSVCVLWRWRIPEGAPIWEVELEIGVQDRG